MVDIGLTFYGSTNDGVQKEAALVHSLFLLMKMALLRSINSFYELMHFDFTVAFPNKNNNNNNKKMEKLGCITKCQKLLKQLPTLSVIIQVNKQH